ncbi:MAG: SNF2/RAD54 family helicase [Ignavibacteria bacterium]|jgi:superfamily II DNA/RNA helicase|nr:SNF2/RAD54 family helicase [Ignavibacteria bacterium]
MSTKFFTNEQDNTLFNKFQGVFNNNPSINCFDAVVGYLRASGYFKTRELLNNIKKIRILVGINVDKYLAEAQARGIIYYANNEQVKNDFLEYIKKDIETSEYTKVIEDGILQFIEDIKRGKIEVRAHPSKRIHAKIYILYPDNFNEHTFNAGVITGSSNFTDTGLGLTEQKQYEFNVLLHDNSDVSFALSEFNKLWEEAEGCMILPQEIEKAKDNTYLAKDITPFELYIKMLIEYFGDRISYDTESFYDFPEGFKKMEYQIEAVDEGYKKLLRYDGFFLSDVVGLGKTVIATMIAKRFSIENGRDRTKILVVYPPAVEKNWKTTFDRFGITNVKFVSNGSLEKVLDTDNIDYWNAEEYDLVLVDESHKFRNHETRMFKQLQDICKSPRINKGSIEGYKKKVILISATPLNNSPEDLYNQILLFQDPRRSNLDGISNLTAFFSPKTVEYKRFKSQPKLNVIAVKKLYEEIRNKVVKPLTIRRTRTDIEKIERYRKDVGDFPKVEKPQKIDYLLDDSQAKLFQETIDVLTEKLTYNRYQAIVGLIPEIREQYYEKAELVSKSLAYIMKTLLVKRLESSFYAFKNSLDRFRIANERMIEMFENDKVFIAPDLDINKFYEKGFSEEEIEKEINKAQEDNPKNGVFKSDDFVNDFLPQLKADQELLNNLCNKWEEVTTDPKLDKFLELLNNKLFDKQLNPGQKLVVFSESTDTINYLNEKITRDDVLTISASNRSKSFETIEENFDANYPKEKQKNDFNVILTTDVLAEGVNLHRSNIIINYDTPWNSTRLMQRIGRVNRIGSKFKNIYNYVFYPSAEGNLQINLIGTSLIKIQSFHTALGGDNQIYSPDEIIDTNLDKLFEASIEKEEVNKELEYLEKLRDFKKENPKEFIRIEKMNLRSRTGRKRREVNNTELHKSSLVFLKTNDRNNFYLVDTEKTRELSSLEAMEFFEAKPEEKSVDRIEEHHEQVNRAKESFKSKRQIEFQETSAVRAAGKHVSSARNLIRELIRLIDVSETKIKLERLSKMVEWGTITSLAVDLNRTEKKLMKEQITKEDCLSLVINLAEKYESYYFNEVKKEDIVEPIIILSESFN